MHATPDEAAKVVADLKAKAESETDTRQCVGCFNEVRPGHREDHSPGCPTGQNGTPNYE